MNTQHEQHSASSIWKYELEITDKQMVKMPIGASMLSVANQNGKLCLWAVVDTEAPLSEREIMIVGTGGPFPMGLLESIGTVIIDSFVWHVFERIYE